VAKESGKDEPAKEEEAWMAIPIDDEQDVSDLEEEMNELTNHSPDFVLDLPDIFDSVDESLDEVIDVDQLISEDSEGTITTDLDAAYLVGTDETCSAEVDLYDSGTTCHMTGFHHRLTNYVDISPVPIKTADKRSFEAIGKGDMYVYLPNRESNSRILLKDVLYAPTMGITLVSISRIAGAGSTVVFTGNVCRIYSKDRDVIGEIRVKGGLYRVLMKGTKAYAYTATLPDNNNEALSLDELHRRLGHVSHDRAKLLVNKGLVEGITLGSGTEVVVCESCEWARVWLEIANRFLTFVTNTVAQIPIFNVCY